MKRPRSATRSNDFCLDCGGRAEFLLGGRPICRACVEAILAPGSAASVKRPRSATRSNRFCLDCGGRAEFLLGGRALCRACVEAILAARNAAPPLLTLSGSPTSLVRCPGCGTTEEEANASGLLGCPACYSALAAGATSSAGR
ncbi:MAG: hypothetical protein AB1725_02440 [Armatimonadota bacterium]